MNIAIDIDDTITDTYETLIPMIGIYYGVNIDKLLKTAPSYKMLKNKLSGYESFVKTNFPIMANIVPLKKDVVKVLNKLKEDGHRIIIITGRNNDEYPDPYKISLDYLTKNNVPFDKLIVNAKDKAKQCILENIDVFIDDNTQICKAVEKTGIRTFQFATKFNKKNKTLNKVDSWEDLYNKISNIYA